MKKCEGKKCEGKKGIMCEFFMCGKCCDIMQGCRYQ